MRDFSDYMDSFGEEQDRRDHQQDQAEALRDEGRAEIVKLIERSVERAYEAAEEGDSSETIAALFVAGLTGAIHFHNREVSQYLYSIIRAELRDDAQKARTA